MRKIILSAVLVASLALTSAAMATTNHTTTGPLKAIDAKSCTVELGKTTYHFAEKCDFGMLKVGEKVKVTYHLFKKQSVGTAIVAA
jgi:hypothetical protein